MSVGQLVRSSHKSRPFGGYGTASRSKIKELKARGNHLLNFSLSFCATQRDCFTLNASNQICKPLLYASSENERFSCHSFARPDCVNDIVKFTAISLTRSYGVLHQCPLLLQLVPAFGIVAFAVWGLEPVLSHSQKLFLQWKDSDWKKSKTHYVYASYLQPVLLWAGVILICRALDPISLSPDASQAVKQRVLHFIRSLSTVSAFAFCISSFLKQMQKLNTEKMPSNDPRNMGFHFVGKTVYTAVWVAAVSLFMELLGFSTKKWITAGGLGTVLLTLAGREIFTNFLSSLMIHATRPFVVNDWIQTKIEGYEVSGTVEHVGWWSPTIIRGEDQESVHIPNHKFTVNVVRNLSQKTHWRIKTHLAISHLDANKINNVVADMRKVLAKNPQIEQQRIHRRVFLEYIDTENQAFMILVSCFVRTSHFEEYLCVKEAIMLDLLRVIRHHRARLATPIRTIQNSYGELDLEDMPFADTMFTHRRHGFYLVDTLSKIYNDTNGSSLISEEQPSRTANKLEDTNTATIRKQKVVNSGLSPLKPRAAIDSEDGEPQEKTPKGVVLEKRAPVASKPEVELTEGADAVTIKSVSHVGAVKDKAPNGICSTTLQPKQEVEKACTSTQHANVPMEENIFLGVALGGAKRTLHIEEESCIAQEMKKELVACKNGGEVPVSVKDRKDAQAIAEKDTDRSSM